MNVDEVMRVRELSDGELLAGLGRGLGSSRRLMTLVIAQLGEVEERRLHLLAGYGSMFAYCTVRLGMSEDEACRRIDVARLARRFPVLFEGLASGVVSHSVAALLKSHLTNANHVALLADVSGKTVRQAREVLAAWFPQPDVPSTIRKLPGWRSNSVPSTGGRMAANASVLPFESVAAASAAPATPPCSPFAAFQSVESAPRGRSVESASTNDIAPAPTDHAVTDGMSDVTAAKRTGAGGASIERTALEAAAKRTATERTATERTATERTALEAAAKRTATERTATERWPLAGGPPPPSRATRASRIEALSPERFKVQFTADAELKRKLELARDLLRHAVPSADLATIIGRALDVLLEKTLRRRFAKTASTAKASAASKGRAPGSIASVTAANGGAARPVAIERELSLTGTASNAAPSGLDETTANIMNGSASHVPSIVGKRSAPGAVSPSANMAMSEPRAPTASSSSPRVPTASAEQSRASAASCSPHDATAVELLPAPCAGRHIPNTIRRTVLERDGLRCTWHGPDGVRCQSRAWLEHDHIIPRGQGGTHDPENIRIYCRAHNGLAAERAYGEANITRIIARRRGERADHPSPATQTRRPDTRRDPT